MFIHELLTFKQIFNMRVPEGILFCPCCEQGTYEPISLFIDSIRTFHFAGIKRIKLPLLECGIVTDGKTASVENYIRGDDVLRGVISSEIVRSAVEEGVKYCKYNIGSNFKKYLQMDIGDLSVRETVKKQIWKLNNEEGGEITIFSHGIDEVLAMIRLENISVYFHRTVSDTSGKESKSLNNSNIYKILIEKMVDGGFILTDEHLAGNNLNYIGECGTRKRMLHVWQVIK